MPSTAACSVCPARLRLAYPPFYRTFRFWYFTRSEEHTSELQSQSNLVCRLLLEKKKTAIHLLIHRLSSRIRISFNPLMHSVHEEDLRLLAGFSILAVENHHLYGDLYDY